MSATQFAIFRATGNVNVPSRLIATATPIIRFAAGAIMPALMLFIIGTATPSSIHAQRFQPAQFAAGSDSFQLVMRDKVRGAMKTVRTVDGQRARLTTDFVSAGIEYRMHRELVLDALTLMPVSYAMQETYRGVTVSSQLAVTDNRAKGTTAERGETGIRRILADVTTPPGTVQAAAINDLLTTLALAEKFKTTVNALVPFPGDILPVTITVLGKETVTVPAGTFEAYRISVEQYDSPGIQVFVTTAVPRRVVLIRESNSELRLVK